MAIAVALYMEGKKEEQRGVGEDEIRASYEFAAKLGVGYGQSQRKLRRSRGFISRISGSNTKCTSHT